MRLLLVSWWCKEYAAASDAIGFVFMPGQQHCYIVQYWWLLQVRSLLASHSAVARLLEAQQQPQHCVKWAPHTHTHTCSTQVRHKSDTPIRLALLRHSAHPWALV